MDLIGWLNLTRSDRIHTPGSVISASVIFGSILIVMFIFDFHLALHLAVQHGHLDVVRRLLSESDIDVFTLNMKYDKFIFLRFSFIFVIFF